MRKWHLTPSDPMVPHIAADARAGHTTYTDDQVWQLRLGDPNEPAISLETRYGGRVGLARVIPIWSVGRRQVYETQGYHTPPALTAFAPDYMRLQADLTLALKLTVEFWTMASQVVGGRFTVHNTGNQPQNVHLNLNAQAVRENQTLPMFFLTLENGQVALQLGKLSSIIPVLMLEDASSSGAQARLGIGKTLGPDDETVFRWVMAGQPDRDASVLLAHRWLTEEDWDAHILAIEERAAAEPQFETGHADWDAALAWSQQLVLRSFLGATGSLPHPSFVASRKPNQGYAVGGVHSGGFAAPWGGQTLPDALTIAATIAPCDPELAKGMVRNFLAVQRSDGWIDAKPGLDGQRANVLAPPLLATLTYTVFHYTDDRDFLADCLDGLLAFFDRWFKKDVDRDRDGLPEWSEPGQGAFDNSPTLAHHSRWAQGLDITTVEAPDLAAYLVREACSLLRIAKALDRDDVIAQITPRYEALADVLHSMWDAERGAFHYRDRDTHACPDGELIFEGKGDQPLDEKTPLPQPSRLVVQAVGGLSHKPKLSCTIEGTDSSGKATNETIPGEAFTWYRGMGSTTTNTVWKSITYLKFDGLSRVYTIQVHSVDLSRHDQSLFMPLWTDALTNEQVQQMVAMLTDPDQYWHDFGVSACPASDPAYDASTQNGCGGMWPSWNERIASALMDHGYMAESRELFERVLAAQLRCLVENDTFRSLYNPETGEGLGDAGVIEGAVSLGWFGRLFGAYMLGPDRAVITGPFVFEGESMRLTHHGVTVERGPQPTVIRFPSGTTITLDTEDGFQVITDPKAKTRPRRKASQRPAKPPKASAEAPGSVEPAGSTEPDNDLNGLLPEID
ncbi:MAG: hypothetical protein JW966_13165 [Anaerolineae bacterium]|nr:hypothetical protein [Anaerolineae bacterium]